MCAILDHSVTYEVFGKKQTTAGKKFRHWLDDGRGVLIVGGKNLRELTQNTNFQRWFTESRRSKARVRQVRDATIAEVEGKLERERQVTSNDVHVLALAVVSGARLLYSNDRKLTRDFRNVEILGDGRGRVFTTVKSKSFTAGHSELLSAEGLCDSEADG